MAVTHTVTRTCVINGVTERPTRAKRLLNHRGRTHEAGDGSPTNVTVSTKARIRYEWESPDPAVVNRMYALWLAGGSFSTTDIYGATYTAILPRASGFDDQVQFETLDPGGVSLTTYPGLVIEVWQA